MTAPATAVREVATQRPDPGDEYHLYCCDENLALCGADLTLVPITDGTDETPCPMCFASEDDPCERCGFDPARAES